MNRDTALAFVAAINAHDTRRILALMTDDHVFIDAYGERENREAMTTGWPGYFEWFPDYHIQVEQILAEGSTVVLLGWAGGTYRGKPGPDGRGRWRLPAAWRVVVEGTLVKVWQVYADSKLPFDAMSDGES